MFSQLWCFTYTTTPLIGKYTYEQVQLKSRELSTKTFLPGDGMGRGQGKAAPACTSQPGPELAAGRRAAGGRILAWGLERTKPASAFICCTTAQAALLSEAGFSVFFYAFISEYILKLVKKDSFLALDNDKMPALLLLSCKDHSMWKFDFFFLAK